MKIINKLRPKKIDQLVYVLEKDYVTSIPSIKVSFDIKNATINKVYCEKRLITKHVLLIQDKIVYRSNTHQRVHIMKCINEYGSQVIGDCFTKKEFRGKSIYPFMLQLVGKEVLQNSDKVFVLVSPYNKASIRGIEKAGFILKCRISAIRLGIFYIKKRITTKPKLH